MFVHYLIMHTARSWKQDVDSMTCSVNTTCIETQHQQVFSGIMQRQKLSTWKYFNNELSLLFIFIKGLHWQKLNMRKNLSDKNIFLHKNLPIYRILCSHWENLSLEIPALNLQYAMCGITQLNSVRNHKSRESLCGSWTCIWWHIETGQLGGRQSTKKWDCLFIHECQLGLLKH